jgi:hypothetical protein
LAVYSVLFGLKFVFETFPSCSFPSSFIFFSYLSFIYSLSSFLFFSNLSFIVLLVISEGCFKPVYFCTFCLGVGVYGAASEFATPSFSFSIVALGFLNTY